MSGVEAEGYPVHSGNIVWRASGLLRETGDVTTPAFNPESMHEEHHDDEHHDDEHHDDEHHDDEHHDDEHHDDEHHDEHDHETPEFGRLSRKFKYISGKRVLWHVVAW